MSPLAPLGLFAFAGAAGGDYESIATVTVGSGGSSSVSFTSIPGTFAHLQVRGIQKMTGAGEASLRFNSDSGSNYANHLLWGDGSSAQAYGTDTQSDIDWLVGPDSTTQFAGFVLDILDYANTNKNTTIRSLSGVDENGSGRIRLSSGVWLNTAAITTITITTSSNNFAQYSHFALYGIKGA